MRKDFDRPQSHQDEAKPATTQGLSRRHLFGTPLALAAGSIAAPSLLGAFTGEANATGNHGGNGNGHPKLDPKYYPLRNFRPEINLNGKLAVITGASRGLGRAVGEALNALGVNVIGTSRNPATVPNPPAFPLLKLDIADPASVFAFPAQLAAHPRYQQRGRVDILVNNAGRALLGQIVPLPPTNPAFFLSQRDLGLRTIYTGHVMMTNVMLPMMRNTGYSRIIFTASIASYITGAGSPGGSILEAYNAAKAAVRHYANALDSAFREGGSSIRVSTVNPYFMNTVIDVHPNPIYTLPVGANGLSATDQAFNAGITFLRDALANGLPPSMVGETFAQLLRMEDPEQNVVVASPREPLATKGQNELIEAGLLAENRLSAVPFK